MGLTLVHNNSTAQASQYATKAIATSNPAQASQAPQASQGGLGSPWIADQTSSNPPIAPPPHPLHGLERIADRTLAKPPPPPTYLLTS